ncbi:hypothetical protein IID23_04795 [Patescibacteria group bacterium]|nr:hypothetical protein [Patescibacteria group bacterium]
MKGRRVFPEVKVDIPFWDWCNIYRELVRQSGERREELKREYGGAIPVERELEKHIYGCKDCLELVLRAQYSLRKIAESGIGLQISTREQIQEDLAERSWGPEQEEAEIIGQVSSQTHDLVFAQDGNPRTVLRTET